MPRKVVPLARLLSILLAASGSLSAQLIDTGIEPDSPVWWTLSDEVSPSELRAEFQSVGGSSQRFKDAIRAGAEAPLDAAGLQRLRFYLNPSVTPELVPMWWAFDNLCRTWLPSDGEVPAQVSIRGYGTTETGAQAVITACHRQAREFQSRLETIEPLQSKFIQLQWDLWARMGDTDEARRQVSDWVQSEDVGALVAVSGVPEEEIRKLLDASKVNVAAEAAADVLPALRQAMSRADWAAFRRFLLEQSAERLGAFRDF